MPTGRELSARPWRRLRAEVLGYWKTVGLPCARCGRPLNYELPAKHAMSATVDHVVSRALAPHRALDRSNLVVMHRRCNSSKGAKATLTNADTSTTRQW